MRAEERDAGKERRVMTGRSTKRKDDKRERKWRVRSKKSRRKIGIEDRGVNIGEKRKKEERQEKRKSKISIKKERIQIIVKGGGGNPRKIKSGRRRPGRWRENEERKAE